MELNRDMLWQDIIQKLVANGYPPTALRTPLRNHIFDHDFAKAFWGEELTHPKSTQRAWEYHLQKMVLEKDPAKYLALFLDKNSPSIKS